MNALIIDDDVVSCKKLSEILEPYATCSVFYEGKKAIEAYDSIIRKGDKIDLITLDIAMPLFDGIDTLKELRSIESNYHINKDDSAIIIMITSSFDKHKITESFEKGCNDYIIKPFDEKKLLARLKSNNLL
ncbi:MAG: hypothetical protein A2Y40_07880 [Candidatus Margulisbacteria bacterium GWF2_35_9]|nr:MAG: hypothetical protein A2Y40_07880 [Candidatus Margulisbacteria bacterium GWF2_35_9]